jgi:catechol 2,3-dioxygenase-like lactoylglutathione lyase family enzyme
MSRLRLPIALTFLVFRASAQLAPPNEQGVAMGHIHLNQSDPAAATAFFTDMIGAQLYTHASLKGVSVPGAVILFTKAAPSGASVGTSVNHIGFTVPDMGPYLARFEKTNYKTTRPTAQGVQLMIDGPDGVRVELTEDRSMKDPIRFHHIHFNTADPKKMQAWYFANFGATPSKRANWDSGEVPGANLTYGPADAVAPTKGRAIDHIGFEIKGLEAFCKKLTDNGIKLDTPYRQITQINLALAFLTDPWGTRIELTEGLGANDSGK